MVQAYKIVKKTLPCRYSDCVWEVWKLRDSYAGAHVLSDPVFLDPKQLTLIIPSAYYKSETLSGVCFQQCLRLLHLHTLLYSSFFTAQSGWMYCARPQPYVPACACACGKKFMGGLKKFTNAMLRVPYQ